MNETRRARRSTYGILDVLIGLAVAVVVSALVASIALAATGDEELDDIPMWLYAIVQASQWVGLVGVPFYLLGEVLSPAVEVVALAALGVAVAVGLFDVQAFLVVLGAMAFFNAALTAAAVLLDDLQRRPVRIGRHLDDGLVPPAVRLPGRGHSRSS